METRCRETTQKTQAVSSILDTRNSTVASCISGHKTSLHSGTHESKSANRENNKNSQAKAKEANIAGFINPMQASARDHEKARHIRDGPWNHPR